MLNPMRYEREYHFTHTDGNAKLTLGKRTLVMGILNVTPDSFSDGGQFNSVKRALEHAKQMIAEGADLLDVGGESTRPGSEPVGLEEELNRVIPVIQALHAAFPDVVLSVDTYKAEVARQALKAGAHIINDVWGCKRDSGMAAVAAEFGCPIILMHNREERNYTDYIADVKSDLLECVKIALAAGVKEGNIWLDPGIGFAKDGRDNLELMHHLDELVELGYPVLLATSRKRFIRDVLQLPVDDVVEGTAATVAMGIAQGCQMVRVHDVRQIVRTVKMCDAMLRGSERNKKPSKMMRSNTCVIGRDRMKLKRMAFYGRHGVFEEERVLGQRWYVDLDLQVDLRKAGLSDDLNQSINYALIHEAVKQIIEQESHQLVEMLAERVATELLEKFPRIQEVKVGVTKPNPPFDIHFEGVTMEITRARVSSSEGGEQ